MRTIIAGSRGLTHQAIVDQAVELSGFVVSEVVSGTAQGVDALGESWAMARGLPIVEFPAKWIGPRGLDRGAGHARNQLMANYAEALVAVWDGSSPGTRDMIKRATKRGLAVFVYDTSLA
jgi:hypothetical protein